MEITIKINGRFVSVEVSAEVADYLEQVKRNNRKLYPGASAVLGTGANMTST